ncbi:MAG: hypothetical protein JNG83_08160 [Opitutaceae bacterium]|nr:hypothetical protein [Opitutaceae bacterium]
MTSLRLLRLTFLFPLCALLVTAAAAAAPRGITGVVTSGPDFIRPSDTPPGKAWVYQLAFPFQVSATRAAVFCDIREGLAKGGGLEAGVDAILFDSLERPIAYEAVPITRNHLEPNPRSQPAGQLALMMKGPMRGGFVPYGAKRADGSPHPHAGTGFSVNQAIGLRTDRPAGSLAAFAGNEAYEYLEVHQLAYDDQKLAVTSTAHLAEGEFLEGWRIVDGGLTNAIADGDDLLVGMTGAKVGESVLGAGVMRWRREDGRWRPVDFVSVTGPGGEGQSTEPSLVRDIDGSLLFCARGGRNEPEIQNDIRIWRSADAGRTWRKIIHARGAISTAPVTLNQAADGTPYVTANLYEVLMDAPDRKSTTDSPVYSIRPDAQGRSRLGGWLRNKVYLWPLNAQRDTLEAPLLVRDSMAEFGRPPGDTSWRVDHPSAMTVRLADGRWHNILGMRVLELGEGSMGLPPTPFTGCYLEEVISSGEAIPLWHF